MKSLCGVNCCNWLSRRLFCFFFTFLNRFHCYKRILHFGAGFFFQFHELNFVLLRQFKLKQVKWRQWVTLIGSNNRNIVLTTLCSATLLYVLQTYKYLETQSKHKLHLTKRDFKNQITGNKTSKAQIIGELMAFEC